MNGLEIIVVDNHSTDDTINIAKNFGFQTRFARRVSDFGFYSYGPERSSQRNFGVNKAKGKYVLYLDADMILSPNVIEECVTMFGNSALVGLYIPEIIMGDSFWSKVRRFERSFYNATVIDAVRFVDKDIFLKINGFDETMSGPEDWDLDKKIRQQGNTSVIKSPIYHNESDFDLKKYLGKKLYYSQSFDRYIHKWGKSDPDIIKQFGPAYRYLTVFIENGKWLKLIHHPVLTGAMFFLRFLVGINYLFGKKN